MGLWDVPAYIGSIAHPVQIDRNLLEGIFTRSGAVRVGDFALSVGPGVRGINVAGGRYFIVGTDHFQQGGYFIYSDDVEEYLLAAAVGNDRVDSFILRVLDDHYGVISGLPRAALDVIQGVPAGSPVARPDSDFEPAGAFYEPGAWFRLGDVRVNVGQVAIPGGQITNNVKYTRIAGRTQVVGVADRPTDPALNDEIYQTSTDTRHRWNGSAWVPIEGKFVANVGDGVAASFALVHNFGTRDVSVNTFRNSTPWDEIGSVVAERTDTNTVTVRFAGVPTTNQYRVVIRG